MRDGRRAITGHDGISQAALERVSSGTPIDAWNTSAFSVAASATFMPTILLFFACDSSIHKRFISGGTSVASALQPLPLSRSQSRATGCRWVYLLPAYLIGRGIMALSAVWTIGTFATRQTLLHLVTRAGERVRGVTTAHPSRGVAVALSWTARFGARGSASSSPARLRISTSPLSGYPCAAGIWRAFSRSCCALPKGSNYAPHYLARRDHMTISISARGPLRCSWRAAAGLRAALSETWRTHRARNCVPFAARHGGRAFQSDAHCQRGRLEEHLPAGGGTSCGVSRFTLITINGAKRGAVLVGLQHRVPNIAYRATARGRAAPRFARA